MESFKKANVVCFTCCLLQYFSLKSQWTFCFSVIAYLINFAQNNQQNNRSLNVWLALNVCVVYNFDSICISIIMFQIPPFEPKNVKKSVLYLMKDYKFQFIQKSVSGILYSRFLSTIDRIRSAELIGQNIFFFRA